MSSHAPESDPEPRLAHGDRLRLAGERAQAEDAYVEAAANGEPGAWVHLGDLYRGHENERSVDAYVHAINNGELDAAVRLGDVLRVLKRTDEALVAYSRGADNGVPEARQRLGELLARTGRLREAAEVYQQGLEQGEPEMGVRLGDVLQQQGDRDGAEAVYRLAAARGDPEGNTRLGDALRARGAFEEALAAYDLGASIGDPLAEERAELLRLEIGADGTGPGWKTLNSWDQSDALYDCALHPDGQQLAVAGEDGVQLWDIATGPHKFRELLFAAGRVWSCTFSPDGLMLAAAGENGLHLWDQQRTATLTESEGVTACAFSPDGQMLATTGGQGLRLTLIANGVPGASRRLAAGAGASAEGGCAFSPDGTLLATATDYGVSVWDVETTQARLRLELPGKNRGDCAFSPDMQLLAVGSREALIVWDLAAKQVLWRLPAGLGGCAFSPDGRWLANGTDEGLVLWDVSRRDREPSPHALTDRAATGGCAFSADGRLLASAGENSVWVGENVAVSARPGPLGAPPVTGESWLPGMSADLADGEDLLDLKADVRAIANVIAAKNLTPPLSIGLFGDWGSGKSFFIRQVQNLVAELATKSRAATSPAYCAHIRNITFNAWHYADANLWASLVTHIFDELGRPDPENGELAASTAAAQLAALEAKLAENSSVKDRLERARVHRKQIEARRELLRLTWRLSGPADQESLDQIRDDAASVTNAFKLLFPNTRTRLLLAAAALLLVAVLLTVLLSAGVPATISWGSAALTALAAPYLAFKLLRRRVLRLLGRVGAAARAVDVRAADIDAELEQANGTERRLQQELGDLAAGRRLARVATERSGDYREHLGLVSQIRSDFARMSELLTSRGETTNTPSSSDPEQNPQLPMIERIVLYIDDLDRCPPARVIEVLEAVHLILAVPLFVVLVAVDPRWLLQSLQQHNAQLLAGLVERQHPVDGDDWAASPIDYLEKIIQVPYTLRPMNAAAATKLVHGLMREDSAPVPEPTQASTGTGGTASAPSAPAAKDGPASTSPGDTGTQPDKPIETAATPQSGSHDDSEETPGRPVRASAGTGQTPRSPATGPEEETLDLSLSPRPVTLTEPERSFASAAAAALSTPRTVKKYTNLYRLLRAGLDERSGQLDTFLDQDRGDAPEYQAALILLAAIIAHPDRSSTFFAQLLSAPEQEGWVSFMREASPAQAGGLRALLESITPPVAESWTCAPFQRWALEVSRYSFTTGQEIFARSASASLT